jgi:menaquinone-dependent protoporphyrinogen oxidase
MKRIVKSGGGDTDASKNHEYTDWQTVEEFARAITSLVDDSASLGGASDAQRAKSHTG